MTQILLPSQIICNLTGSSKYNGTTYNIVFPGFGGEFYNEIDMAGSNCSGAYLGNPPSNTTPTQTQTLFGSGGGNLGGTPDVIYLNLKGALDVAIDTTSEPNHNLLRFTAILQITITGHMAELQLVNPYGVINYSSLPLKDIFTDTFILESGQVSVIYSGCTRYITVGILNLTFNLS